MIYTNFCQLLGHVEKSFEKPQPFRLDIQLNPKPDGNCQFESMSDQLKFQMNVNIDHYTLRKLCVDYLEKNGPDLEFQHFVSHESWDMYLANMRRKGIFGDHLTLTATAHIFHVQIIILQPTARGNLISYELGCEVYNPAVTSLYLGYFGENTGDHYVSLVPPISGTNISGLISDKTPALSDSSTVPAIASNVLLELNTSCRPRTVSTGDKHSEDQLAQQEQPVSPGASEIPDCWTPDQANYFRKENQWLVIRSQKLGCQICKGVKNMALLSSQGIRLSSEWRECSIKPFGSTKSQQQSALRKKINEHKLSQAHQRAAALLTEAESNIMPNSIAAQQSEHYDTTCRVFRTVYNLVKQIRPFTDLQSNIDVQKLNGLNMGRILHSKTTCATIAKHLADEMRNRIIPEIVSNQCPVSILIDESTSLSQKATLIIYLRTVLPGNTVSPVTFFLDLVELDSTVSSVIASTLLTTLNNRGLSCDFLREKLVGFTSDGASVMLGKKAGVAKIFSDQFPRIVIWHCIAHRLELSLHDSVTEVAGVNRFKCFLDKLYTVYHASPKNRNELQKCAAAVNTQLLSIGRLLDTRWVASSYRTLKAVWQSYSALSNHFQYASNDMKRDTKDRACYKGLLLKLTSEDFLLDMATMLDALQELAELSVELQRKSLNIIDSDRAVSRQIRVFEAMATNPGSYFKEATKAAEEGTFNEIQLHKATSNMHTINPGQLYRSLAENMKNRLIGCRSSHTSSLQSSLNENSMSYTKLIDAVKVLYPENWPEDADPLFGENEINYLCTKLSLSIRPAVRAFRMFVESKGKVIDNDLKSLVSAIEAIAVSTAECERGFSCMNLTLSDTRNSLAISTVSSLMFLKLVAPPLHQFQPLSYVKSWLAKGHHAATDVNSSTHQQDNTSGGEMFAVWKLFE